MVHSTRLEIFSNDTWFVDNQITNIDNLYKICVSVDYRIQGILTSQNPEEEFTIITENFYDWALYFMKSSMILYPERINLKALEAHIVDEVLVHIEEDYRKEYNQNSDLYNALAHIYDKD